MLSQKEARTKIPKRRMQADACRKGQAMLKYEEEIRVPSFPEEDKQEICNLLCRALQATLNAWDLVSLDYDPVRETVTVLFMGGGTRQINVACDSGTAMIRDIMRHLGV